MIDLIIKNEFILKEEDYKKIGKFLKGKLKKSYYFDYEYNQDIYKLKIRIHCDSVSGDVNIWSTLTSKYDMSAHTASNKVYQISDLYLSFNNIYENVVIYPNEKRNISVCFSFILEGKTKDLKYYLDKKESIKEYKDEFLFLNTLTYVEFNNDLELFSGLYHILIKAYAVEGLTTKHLLSVQEQKKIENLQLIIHKFAYYGYDEDYLESYDKNITDKVLQHIANHSYKISPNEIFDCFMFNVLNLILNGVLPYYEVNLMEFNSDYFYDKYYYDLSDQGVI